MGYRSEVAYVIQFKDIQTKKEWVALKVLDNTHKKALDECNFVDDMTKDYISAYFDWVKWYDGYEDVDMHTRLLEAITEEEPEGVNARFVRIGENNDDADDLAYGDDGYNIELYLSRSIDTMYDLGTNHRD